MSWRLFSFGIALAAVYTAYQHPSQIPLSTYDAALSIREFWHRTFMQYSFASPYVLSEQTHVVQHPPPKDALSPALVKKLQEEQAPPKSITSRMPVYFISHGFPENMFEPQSLPYKSWQALGREIAELNPTAIVVASSRWEGSENEEIYVTEGSDNNELLYDFKDLPSEYYEQGFTSPSHPDLSQRIVSLLREKKIKASTRKRGLDHGVWVPFKAMFNGTTSIPIVQVSLFDTGSAKIALKLGQALQSLREERILIIGTGMTVFNPGHSKKYSITFPAPYADTFDEAVRQMVTDNTGSNRITKAQMIVWRPEYRQAHPSPEALFALYFAVGASGDDEGEVLFSMLDGHMAWGNMRFGQTDQVM